MTRAGLQYLQTAFFVWASHSKTVHLKKILKLFFRESGLSQNRFHQTPLNVFPMERHTCRPPRFSISQDEMTSRLTLTFKTGILQRLDDLSCGKGREPSHHASDKLNGTSKLV